jgi:hypothetical protein
MSEARLAADMAAMGADPPSPAPAPEPAPAVDPEPATAADLAPEPEPTAEPAAEPVAEPAASTDRPPRTGNGMQDRMHELTRRAREEKQAREAAERRETELKAALDRMAATLEKLAPPERPTPQTGADTPRPQARDFADPDEYQVALTEWASERTARRVNEEYRRGEEERRREVQQAEDRRREQERIQTIDAGYQSRRAKFMAEHPDYPEVAENESTIVSNPMIHILKTNELGPAMAYWLGQNPTESERIAHLTLPDGTPDLAAQIFEMGLIAAAVRRPNGATSAPTAPRPAVINPVRAIGTASPRNQNDKSMEEMDADYRNEMKARIGGRS